MTGTTLPCYSDAGGEDAGVWSALSNCMNRLDGVLAPFITLGELDVHVIYLSCMNMNAMKPRITKNGVGRACKSTSGLIHYSSELLNLV